MRAPSRSSLLILARIFAAVPGGYALTYLGAAAASLWLPMPRSEAVLYASAFCFLIYLGLAFYSFALRSVLWLCGSLVVTAVVLGALIWWGRT